jgi:hypothetical protein
MEMDSVLERLDEEILSCDIDNPPFGFKTVYLLAKQLDRENVLVELVNRFLDRSLEDSKTKSMIESFIPEDALVFLQDVERFKNRTSAYSRIVETMRDGKWILAHATKREGLNLRVLPLCVHDYGSPQLISRSSDEVRRIQPDDSGEDYSLCAKHKRKRNEEEEDSDDWK